MLETRVKTPSSERQAQFGCMLWQLPKILRLVILWRQIISAQMNQTSRITPQKLVIKTDDYRTITVHSLIDISDLARKIQRATAQAQQTWR